jgi:hypothetical protein
MSDHSQPAAINGAGGDGPAHTDLHPATGARLCHHDRTAEVITGAARCFTSVTRVARNDQLRDPGDVAGAQRWAPGCLDALEDRFRAGQDPALLADDPLRQVTEWWPFIVDTGPEKHGSAWLRLYSHTHFCLIPFCGLRATTGAVCVCQHPGGDR